MNLNQTTRGHTHFVQGKGDVNFWTIFGIKKITNIYYVPILTKNILFVYTRTNNGYNIMFDVQQCILAKTKQFNKVVAKG